mmetsp:Transcript_40349/g.46229  ORF Transcript_40349/g.46229 Transcript_40349/m.46229 type:complete len:113 (+) Transcript_40349:102-440(+)
MGVDINLREHRRKQEFNTYMVNTYLNSPEPRLKKLGQRLVDINDRAKILSFFTATNVLLVSSKLFSPVLKRTPVPYKAVMLFFLYGTSYMVWNYRHTEDFYQSLNQISDIVQ